MINLSIDTLQKKARCELVLKGENVPITFTVDEYEIVTEDTQVYLVVLKATASREWMDVMIQDFVLGRKLVLPSQYRHIIRMML